MLFISIILLLLSNAVTVKRDKSIPCNKIAILIISAYFFLLFSSLHVFLHIDYNLFNIFFYLTNKDIFLLFISIIIIPIFWAFYINKFAFNWLSLLPGILYFFFHFFLFIINTRYFYSDVLLILMLISGLITTFFVSLSLNNTNVNDFKTTIRIFFLSFCSNPIQLLKNIFFMFLVGLIIRNSLFQETGINFYNYSSILDYMFVLYSSVFAVIIANIILTPIINANYIDIYPYYSLELIITSLLDQITWKSILCFIGFGLIGFNIRIFLFLPCLSFFNKGFMDLTLIKFIPTKKTVCTLRSGYNPFTIGTLTAYTVWNSASPEPIIVNPNELDSRYNPKFIKNLQFLIDNNYTYDSDSRIYQYAGDSNDIPNNYLTFVRISESDYYPETLAKTNISLKINKSGNYHFHTAINTAHLPDSYLEHFGVLSGLEFLGNNDASEHYTTGLFSSFFNNYLFNKYYSMVQQTDSSGGTSDFKGYFTNLVDVATGMRRYLSIDHLFGEAKNKTGHGWSKSGPQLQQYTKHNLGGTNNTVFGILMKDTRVAFFIYCDNWHYKHGMDLKAVGWNGLIGFQYVNRNLVIIPQSNTYEPQVKLYNTNFSSHAEAIHCITKHMYVNGVVYDLDGNLNVIPGSGEYNPLSVSENKLVICSSVEDREGFGINVKISDIKIPKSLGPTPGVNDLSIIDIAKPVWITTPR